MVNSKVAAVPALLVVALLVGVWWWQQPPGLSDAFAQGHGRIEATEIVIASKQAGRVEQIFVDEGDNVQQGGLVAKLDTRTLQAQLEQAQALVQQSLHAKATAQAGVKEQQSQKTAAEATVAQRQAAYNVAQSKYKRSQSLLKSNLASPQDVETDQANALSAKAALEAAKAQVAAVDAGIVAAESKVVESESAIAANQATVVRLQAELEDAKLTAPRNVRVQYRVVQPGEVVASGGAVLSTVDLENVYMNFFLPEQQTGKVALGAEARIVLDAAQEFVIPASISYVASVAQFTPRSVETDNERQKLMFKVKAKIDPALLRQYQQYVKTGLPGKIYVRLGQEVWPEWLQTRLPE